MDAGQLKPLLAGLRERLPGAMYEQVEGLLTTLQWVLELIRKKNPTLVRQQRLIFGAATENTRPPRRPRRTRRQGAATRSRAQWRRSACGRPTGGGDASQPEGWGRLSGLPDRQVGVAAARAYRSHYGPADFSGRAV